MSALTRTYVCPECGYDGFRMGEVKSPVDVNVQMGCPACAMVRDRVVWLVETSDPRAIADGLAGDGTDG